MTSGSVIRLSKALLLGLTLVTGACSRAPVTSPPAAVAYPKFTAKDYLSRDYGYRMDWLKALKEDKLPAEPTELVRSLLEEPIPGFKSELAMIIAKRDSVARDQAVLSQKARFLSTGNLKRLGVDCLSHSRAKESIAFIRTVAKDPDPNVSLVARNILGLPLNYPAPKGGPRW